MKLYTRQTRGYRGQGARVFRCVRCGTEVRDGCVLIIPEQGCECGGPLVFAGWENGEGPSPQGYAGYGQVPGIAMVLTPEQRAAYEARKAAPQRPQWHASLPWTRNNCFLPPSQWPGERVRRCRRSTGGGFRRDWGRRIGRRIGSARNRLTAGVTFARGIVPAFIVPPLLQAA